MFGTTRFVSKWEEVERGETGQGGVTVLFLGGCLRRGIKVLTGTWLAQLNADEAETPLFRGIK
jgi:hypothetical protein